MASKGQRAVKNEMMALAETLDANLIFLAELDSDSGGSRGSGEAYFCPPKK